MLTARQCMGAHADNMLRQWKLEIISPGCAMHLSRQDRWVGGTARQLETWLWGKSKCRHLMLKGRSKGPATDNPRWAPEILPHLRDSSPIVLVQLGRLMPITSADARCWIAFNAQKQHQSSRPNGPQPRSCFWTHQAPG